VRYQTSDFDYSLPAAQIAQAPLPDRSASRLLVLDRANGTIRHAQFRDMVDLVAPEDVLVLNTSRVIPARLHGTRGSGRGAELLLIRERPDGTWLAMGHPGGKLKAGRTVRFGEDSAVEIVSVLGGGLRTVKFLGPLDARQTLARYGEVPLPPYIRRAPNAEDRERYQTVFAEHDGSVAAPTAGLHFTLALLARLRAQGAAITGVDLHIGPGTFKPVRVDELSKHSMDVEAFIIGDDAALTINTRRQAGGRVWAVGTTVVRTLETCVAAGRIIPGAGETRLFIRPPYVFSAVDCLLTNFHLPRSTLLMLVCAFGGYESVMRAYRAAVQEGYRFYSYGDAMAII
jgi:S-adenosylmethionine:tRNA ribosyltransferase-isomerase